MFDSGMAKIAFTNISLEGRVMAMSDNSGEGALALEFTAGGAKVPPAFLWNDFERVPNMQNQRSTTGSIINESLTKPNN